jgi:hypothetical protein
LTSFFLVATLALGASTAVAVHFVPTYVPRGYHLLEADEYKGGFAEIGYVFRHGDEADLAVYTNTGRACCLYATSGDRPISIRGHRATISSLVDGADVYGREILWQERPGVWIEVVSGTLKGLNDHRLKVVAEEVATVSDRHWRRLEVGTSLPPPVSQLPAGRPSRIVERGRVHGHTWVLRALIPRGYSLGWYDFRSPCSQLSYRGRTTYGFDCDAPTSWELVKGQIFVFGVLRPSVHRVQVRAYHDNRSPGVVVRTRTIERLRGFAFYVVPMPRSTCEVDVRDAGRHGGRGEIGRTGPFMDPSEQRRCFAGGR